MQRLQRGLELQPDIKGRELVGDRRGGRMGQHISWHAARRPPRRATEVQQLTDDAAQALHLAANLQQPLARAVFQALAAQHALGLAIDHAQRATQLMSDARRQPAHGGELLGPSQARLEFRLAGLLLGHALLGIGNAV